MQATSPTTQSLVDRLLALCLAVPRVPERAASDDVQWRLCDSAVNAIIGRLGQLATKHVRVFVCCVCLNYHATNSEQQSKNERALRV